MAEAEGPRATGPADLAGVIGLVDGAMRQGSHQTMRTDYPLVYADTNLANVQVILVDGRPVATAPVLPRRVEGRGFAFGMGVISPTATDPAHQHRGYGAACVRACAGRMETLGLELSVLWTAVATFPFYELNGWQAVERYGASYQLASRDATRFGSWPGRIAALSDEPARLDDVLALHQAVGPGVVRSRPEAAALFALPEMTTWLAMADDRVASYLVDSHATNKPGLLEAAGDPQAVAGLIRHALGRRPADSLAYVSVGFAPDGLTDAAASALPDVTPEAYPGNMMVRLNDPAGFLRGIRSWLAAHKPADARSVSIHVTDSDVTVSVEWRAFGVAIGSRELPDHVELTRRELTAVIFGPHPDRPVESPPELAWLPRFQVPIPVLDRS